jgi:hypothetical protein
MHGRPTRRKGEPVLLLDPELGRAAKLAAQFELMGSAPNERVSRARAGCRSIAHAVASQMGGRCLSPLKVRLPSPPVPKYSAAGTP